jgi:TetR/AcrR family transcriptional regulator, lmrAB and yxaGH operons repressor
MATDTRARMLETTARLLQHRGYHGTTLSTILQASGAPRGSLYFHFPGGKDQVVLEATRLAVDETTAELRRALDEAPTPGAGVRVFFDAAAGIMHETEYTFGCPVAPVILDASGGVDELAELCRSAFEDWLGLLERAFTDAGIPTERARTLAMLIESALEGVLIIARAYRDEGLLRALGLELEAVVNAALPRR